VLAAGAISPSSSIYAQVLLASIYAQVLLLVLPGRSCSAAPARPLPGSARYQHRIGTNSGSAPLQVLQVPLVAIPTSPLGRPASTSPPTQLQAGPLDRRLEALSPPPRGPIPAASPGPVPAASPGPHQLGHLARSLSCELLSAGFRSPPAGIGPWRPELAVPCS
jgi:hypothetical protein